jgi:hypothetical protein
MTIAAEITGITLGRHRRHESAEAPPGDVTSDSATRFGLLLEAVQRGNRPLAAEMLLSIPATDLEAIEARLALFDLDLPGLLKGSHP